MNKVGPYPTLYTKINSKWIEDSNLRPKIPKRNHKKKALRHRLSNNFLAMTLKVQATNAKIGKQDSIKLKNFCASNNTNNRMK